MYVHIKISIDKTAACLAKNYSSEVNVIQCQFCLTLLILGFLNALKDVAAAFLAVENVHGWDASAITDRATFDDALHVQTVIDSIKQSSHTKQWVNIKILDEEPDPNPHLSSVVRRSAYSAF